MSNKIDLIFENPQELETAQVILRPVIKDDYACFKACWSNIEVRKYIASSKLKTYSELKETFEHIFKSRDQKYYFAYTIFDRSSSKAIGYFYFYFINNIASHLKIGFELIPDFWNKGIMTEVLKIILKYLFEGIELNKVCAEVNAEHKASRKVLEKCGFNLEGILRENDYYYHLDKFCDDVQYGILRKDWKQRFFHA